jgi:hypothetical protein
MACAFMHQYFSHHAVDCLTKTSSILQRYFLLVLSDKGIKQTREFAILSAEGVPYRNCRSTQY